jgi:NitT/TauT family transport system permease protein
MNGSSSLSILFDLLDRFAVVIALVALLIVWEAAADLGRIPIFILPAPSDIWASIVKNWSALLNHAWVTLLETLAGFGLSVAVGIPLAVLIVYSRIFDRVVYPMLVASQAVPKVALAPILLVVLGYGVSPKIIVAFLIAFFPVVVNTVTGLASVDRDTLNLMHSMGVSKMDVFRKVRFPHAVPSMIRSRSHLPWSAQLSVNSSAAARALATTCCSQREISTRLWFLPVWYSSL